MRNENALIIIAKYPEQGKVKTRIMGLTDEQRVRIYVHLLHLTLKKLSNIDGVDTWIAFAPSEAEDYFKQFSTGLIPLSDGDLGERMHQAFQETFDRGYRMASLVGADIPDLNAGLIIDSFRVLEQNDLVFGPARDGGYYLIGMRRLISEVFRDVPWSSDETLARSIKKALSAGCSYGLLQMLSDIDTIDDLQEAGLLGQAT
jgi:hypothetical protein